MAEELVFVVSALAAHHYIPQPQIWLMLYVNETQFAISPIAIQVARLKPVQCMGCTSNFLYLLGCKQGFFPCEEYELINCSIICS